METFANLKKISKSERLLVPGMSQMKSVSKPGAAPGIPSPPTRGLHSFSWIICLDATFGAEGSLPSLPRSSMISIKALEKPRVENHNSAKIEAPIEEMLSGWVRISGQPGLCSEPQASHCYIGDKQTNKQNPSSPVKCWFK